MTNRPTALPVNTAAIPEDLKAMRRWVMWRYTKKKKPNGTFVWTKMPFTTNNTAASSTKANMWCTYDEAADALLMGDFDGIGITLGDDLHGIDLDDCRDPKTGALNDFAKEVVERVHGYAEVSPSGTGLKIFCNTNLDGSRTKKEVGVELYKDGRYFTVTGQVLSGHEKWNSEAQDLNWLVEKVWHEQLGAPPSDDDGTFLLTMKNSLDGWDLDRVVDEVLVHLDPDCGYEEWLKIGAALNHQGNGEPEWLEVWDNWSAGSSMWVEGYCADKWASFSKERAVGRGAVTLASLLHNTKDARGLVQIQARKELEKLIESTTDFDELTKVILKLVYEKNMPKSDQELLIKKIAAKTKVSVQSLKADGVKFRSINASNQQLHLNAAKEVIKLFGKDDLIFAQGITWYWSEKGIWEQVDDRQLKQKIHKVAGSNKLTSSVISSILDILKTEINRDGVVFDQPRDSINCTSGELHYCKKSGLWQQEQHLREHYRTAQIPLSYDPSASAPRFEQFLNEVFAGDDDAHKKKLTVEEALGYTLLASCRFEKLFMLYGGGANGKSVLLAVVRELVGASLVSAVQPKEFDNKYQLAHMQGKLANIVPEIAESGAFADDKLKALVSGELSTAERKFGDPFNFQPIATHWFGTNHLPRTRDFSGALFRRVVVLGFNNRFDGDKRDVDLVKKLCAELPGIFNIALNGLARLITKNDFTECPSSESIKKEWSLEVDQVKQFVEMCCEVAPQHKESSQRLFQAYRGWTQQVGINRTLAQNTFTNRLRFLKFAPHRNSKERYLLGLALKPRDFLE